MLLKHSLAIETLRLLGESKLKSTQACLSLQPLEVGFLTISLSPGISPTKRFGSLVLSLDRVLCLGGGGLFKKK